MNIQPFSFISDAETVNDTYEIHQIDLNTMLHNGECADEDKIEFDYDGECLRVSFVGGGHLIDPTDDEELIESVYKNQDTLSVYE